MFLPKTVWPEMCNEGAIEGQSGASGAVGGPKQSSRSLREKARPDRLRWGDLRPEGAAQPKVANQLSAACAPDGQIGVIVRGKDLFASAAISTALYRHRRVQER
jgi:hypothetical protein